MYDIIGDIHGYYNELCALLKKMGYEYDLTSDFFSHPDGRKAVFVGDFVDRGPDNVKTIRLIRNMVNAGNAHAIMGNHDFNAVLWATPHPDKEGEFQRPHTKKNRDQHQTYLDEVENDPILLREMTEWLKSLPIFLEIGNANIVHACWYPTGIKTLQNSECLDENGCLTNKGWNAAADKSSPFYECIEILLKGPKENLPKGQSYPDAQGETRTRSRIAWWNENPTINSEGYASLPECDFAKQPFNSRSANSTSVKIIKDIKSMPLDKKIFIGHISLSACPKPLSDRVISVDYFANTNQLVAFRMNNPQIAHQGHFISVPAQGLNRQQRKRVVK